MGGAPLPLLGTFHEISVAADDVRAAVEFYERLGFTQATTTDTLTHPYGVLTDGRLFIGLHRRAGPSPVLTFVRPGIAGIVAAFAAAGIRLTSSRTGEHVFNEIAFADPFGHAAAVLEARTYSPVARGASETSLCGDFAEVSLPVTDFAAARSFWEELGFVAAEEAEDPYPHMSLTSDYLDLAFHQPRTSERPMIVFRDAGMPARLERLRELEVAMYAAPVPARQAAGSALLEGPDGTPLLLLEEEL
jgi:catechol 2,3-dioxygenase-like lactoylglutathione lyase family enzyme